MPPEYTLPREETVSNYEIAWFENEVVEDRCVGERERFYLFMVLLI